MNEAAASEDIYALFLHNLRAEGIDDRVNILRGSSKKILPNLKAEAYHLIYIDGSHLYPDVLSDIGQAKRLILNRGIICGDDLEIQADEVPAHELAQAVESRLDYTSVGSDPRFFHPGVTAAVAEELGVVSAWGGYWAIRWERGKVNKIVLDLTKVNLPAHIQRAVDQEPVLPDEDTPVLIRTVGEFNLISFKGQVIGIHLSSGPIDVREGIPSILERLGPDKVLIGANEDNILCGIALRKKMKELEDRQAKVAERVESRIMETDAALRKDVQQSEARQTESVELLRQQVAEHSRILTDFTRGVVGRLLFPKNKNKSR